MSDEATNKTYNKRTKPEIQIEALKIEALKIEAHKTAVIYL